MQVFADRTDNRHLALPLSCEASKSRAGFFELPGPPRLAFALHIGRAIDRHRQLIVALLSVV